MFTADYRNRFLGADVVASFLYILHLSGGWIAIFRNSLFLSTQESRDDCPSRLFRASIAVSKKAGCSSSAHVKKVYLNVVVWNTVIAHRS